MRRLLHPGEQRGQQPVLGVDHLLPGHVGQLEVIRHGQGACRAGLDAQPAQDAAQVIDLVHLAVPLAGAEALVLGVVGALDVDRVGGAGPGAQLTADALLQAVRPAVQLVASVEARCRDLLLALLGVALGEGLAEDGSEGNPEPCPRVEDAHYFSSPTSAWSASAVEATTPVSSGRTCPGIGGTG